MRANEMLLISDLKHSLYKNHDAEKLFLHRYQLCFFRLSLEPWFIFKFITFVKLSSENVGYTEHTKSQVKVYVTF